MAGGRRASGLCRWAVTVLLFAGTVAMAGSWSGDWFVSSDGLTRYNPDSGESQYRQGENWEPDTSPGTNPARREFLEGVCHEAESGPGWLVNPFTLEWFVMVQGRVVTGTQYWAAGGGEADPCLQLFLDLIGTPFFQSSTLPGWDLRLEATASSNRREYEINAAGDTYEGRSGGGGIALFGRRDLASFIVGLDYGESRGLGESDGIDSHSLALSVMPGYRLLTQAGNGLNLDVYGVLGLSRVDHEDELTHWRVSTGAAVAASRVTPIGLLHCVYSFSHDRNQGGDEEITGRESIDLHGVNVGWMAPLSQHIGASVALDHTHIPAMPRGFEDDFTDVRVGLRTLSFERWRADVGVRRSLEESGDYGFDVSVGFQW